MNRSSLHIILSSLAFSLVTNSAAAQGAPGSPDQDAGHGDPFLPAGSILVTPTVVQAGVQPQMTWDIEYPKSIEDLFDLADSGTLQSTNPKPEKLGVRVIGSSFHPGGEDSAVVLWIRVGGPGSPWELLFNGTPADVDPTEFVYNSTIHSGTIVDFAVQGGTATNGWLNLQWTITGSPNHVALLDGEPIPSNSSALANGEAEGFLTQFITENGTINLGPREILYLFELGSDEPGSPSFDLQDLAIVVSSAKGNNGHGNNLDGVDVSNPGNGHGGPNGQVDESGSIDDEGKIKKKK